MTYEPADELVLVTEASPVRVEAHGDLVHLCPHVEEIDHGSVEVGWTCDGNTVELHSLKKYLDAFEEASVSSEWITERIRADLSGMPGIKDVTVSTCWDTASMRVVITTP